MLKQSFSILFLLGLIVQVLYLPALSIYLEYNRTAIADKFCVNKLEPELLCSGRCYISSVTADALGDQEDQSQAPASQEQIPTTLFASTFHALDLSLSVPDKQKPDLGYAERYSFQYLSGIFHPPRG